MSDVPDPITLAAVQLHVTEGTFASRETFERAVRAPLREADANVDLGPDSLVAYPEDVGLLTVLLGKGDLLADAETLADGVGAYIRAHPLAVGYRRLRHRASWPRALFIAEQERMADAYFETFSGLAGEFSTYLVAGSGAFTGRTLRERVPAGIPGRPAAADHRVYNASVVFGPDGRVAGVQRKTHLLDIEGTDGLDLSAAPESELVTIPTALGELGVAVCFDAFHDGVLSRLEAGGADILVQPTANPEHWEPWQQAEWLEGCPDAVRDRPFAYGVNPLLVGRVLDLPFEGQSAVLGARGTDESADERDVPGYPDAEPRREFLALSDSPTEGAVVTAEVPHPERASR